MLACLPELTRPILEKLVRDLLNAPSTSATTSALVKSSFSSLQQVKSFRSSVLEKVNKEVETLDSRRGIIDPETEEYVTTDDYAAAMTPFLDDVKRLRDFESPGGVKIAMELLMDLGEFSTREPEEGCGYAEQEFAFRADESMLDLVRVRHEEEGEEWDASATSKGWRTEATQADYHSGRSVL